MRKLNIARLIGLALDFLYVFFALLFVYELVTLFNVGRLNLLVLVIFSTIIILKINSSLAESKKKLEQLSSWNEELTKQLNHCIKSKDILSSKKQKLEKKYEVLQDRYNRVKILYPFADEKVSNMIKQEEIDRNKSLALEVTTQIDSALYFPPDREHFTFFAKAKESYSNLTKAQQSYVNSDLYKLNCLYYKSLRCKQEYDKLVQKEKKKRLADIAMDSVKSIISDISTGTESNLCSLQKAKTIYDKLDTEARLIYFDKSLSNKLDRLYREAKQDQEKHKKKRDAHN